MENSMKNKLAYSVGGLLYTPALNGKIGGKILRGEIPHLRSVAFCLEDSVSDGAVENAEKQLAETFREIALSGMKRDSLPLLFVRVRSPLQMLKVHELIGRYGLLTGYIFPKLDMSNGREYFEGLVSLGDGLYAMPIIESVAVADCIVRRGNLGKIKGLADSYRDRILNIRVGGNDFCNLYGVRRSVSQTIYEAGTVRDILVDILNVFGGDYVVSAPVWEYFGEDEKGSWATGLKKEMAQDRLNGFVGKTAIHPYQLPVIDRAMRPSERDFKDAERILSWSGELAVGRGEGRMNEVKCHLKWAERTALLGEIYGVAEE